MKILVERCKASHVSCFCVSAFGCIACAVGCVCIEDAVCERCVLGFCVCRGRGKDHVCEAPTLRTCVDASNFLQFAFTESVILRFEQEEYESGLKLHASDDHDATDDKDAKDEHKHAKDYNDANDDQDSDNSVGIR